MGRGRLGLWLVIVAAVVVPSACRTAGHGLDWGWRAERPADPLRVFSHQDHKDVFARLSELALPSGGWIQGEIAHWAKLVKLANIQPE